MNKLLSIARGVWLLRNKELVRSLGTKLTELRLAQQVREMNPGCTFDDEVVLRGWQHGRLSLGPGTRIERGTVIALGDSVNGWGAVTFGSNSWVGEYNNFRAAGKADIDVGADCLISQFCSLIASNHDTSGRDLMRKTAPACKKRGIRIEDGVWLGASCTLLPGIVVGEGAVIGAHSVVLADVPAFEVWAGQPARKIYERNA